MPATLDDILTSHQTRRPIIMGVLNVTPDSFSDGGEFFDPGQAVAQAGRMIDEGADIIDIGAESTRPGSDRVSSADQIDRIKSILPAVVGQGAIVSIDTTIADVARFALDAGATIVNDVSAGRDDPELLALVAEREVPVCLMHMLGEPKTMQADPVYDDVVGEVGRFLTDRAEAAMAAGVCRERIIVDPGIGFGKTLQHNLALLAGVGQLVTVGYPVLIGASRKRFIGEIAGETNPANRVAGTLAACLSAWREGASIFRVHDVAEASQAFAVARAIDSAV
jgi:dihydropteroate synthase